MRLIDADALKLEFNVAFDDSAYHAYIAGEVINAAPTIDPVRHGKWILKKHSSGARYKCCSECGRRAGAVNDKYCARCGAIMDDV